MGKEQSKIYENLVLRDNKIRILYLSAGTSASELRCQLKVKDPATTDFEALSYMWGDPTPVHQITINGTNVGIADNLHTALLYLRPRRGRSRRLWVDALCINQADNAEKDREIPRMNLIYPSARRVVAWLGLSDEKTDAAIDFFNKGWKKDELEATFDTFPELWEILRDSMMNRKFWRRAWVVQEMILAKQIALTYGHRDISADLFADLLHMTGGRSPHIYTYREMVRDGSRENTLAALRLMISRQGYHKMMSQGVHPAFPFMRRLHYWLMEFSELECSNTKDLVYAFLGLVENHCFAVQTSDEVPWTDVLIDTTKQIIMTEGGLDFCLLEQWPRQNPVLPSWVPDITLPRKEFPMLPPVGDQKTFLASRGALFTGSFSGSSLHVNGVFVTKVAHVASQRQRLDIDCLLEAMSMCWGVDHSRQTAEYPPDTKYSYRSALAQTLFWDLDNETRRGRGKVFFNLDQEDSQEEFVKSMGLQWEETENRYMVYAPTRDRWFPEGRYRQGRYFALFDKDYIGMISTGREGDEVWILESASLPVILRRNEDGSYELICECYVHGIMDGEAWRATQVRTCIQIV